MAHTGLCLLVHVVVGLAIGLAIGLAPAGAGGGGVHTRQVTGNPVMTGRDDNRATRTCQ